MRYVKWSVLTVLALFFIAFLHYTLPQHDIVRIVNTEVRRVDIGENSWFWASPDVGNAAAANRDIRFIETIRPNGKPVVYRNEDTGWGWPPYFKLDSSNLQAEASDLVSTRDAPIWVAVRHYGWRNEFLTIFPNAVSVRQVEGPDVRLMPWLNVSIRVGRALLLLFLRALWRQVRERTIDPLLDDGRDAYDRIDAFADEKRSGIRRWLDTWRRKPPR